MASRDTPRFDGRLRAAAGGLARGDDARRDRAHVPVLRVPIDQVKAPGRLASALVDHLGALLLHLDMGPSALSVEIPVQQVLRDGRAIWVPVLVVGTPLGAQLMRMTAGAVRDALGAEYIRTAREGARRAAGRRAARPAHRGDPARDAGRREHEPPGHETSC